MQFWARAVFLNFLKKIHPLFWIKSFKILYFSTFSKNQGWENLRKAEKTWAKTWENLRKAEKTWENLRKPEKKPEQTWENLRKAEFSEFSENLHKKHLFFNFLLRVAQVCSGLLRFAQVYSGFFTFSQVCFFQKEQKLTPRHGEKTWENLRKPEKTWENLRKPE